MADWKEVLWKECKKALIKGGEIKIIFTKRDNKRIPLIQSYIDNYIRCDEETVIEDD